MPGKQNAQHRIRVEPRDCGAARAIEHERPDEDLAPVRLDLLERAVVAHVAAVAVRLAERPIRLEQRRHAGRANPAIGCAGRAVAKQRTVLGLDDANTARRPQVRSSTARC